MAIGFGEACPKPEPRKRTKARKQRVAGKQTEAVRAYVFDREWGACRCCRFRAADSMHELRPRSLRGKVSIANSVAVCGSGTTLCHGLLQAKQIDWTAGRAGAEGTVSFKPRTQRAADHMRVKLHEWIESGPYPQMETRFQ